MEKTCSKKHPPKQRFNIRTMNSKVLGLREKKKISKSTTFANTGLHQEGELSYSIFKIVLQG